MDTVEGIRALPFTEGKSSDLGDGNLTGFKQCAFWEPGKDGLQNWSDWANA
jgi:hypothetical protein